MCFTYVLRVTILHGEDIVLATVSDNDVVRLFALRRVRRLDSHMWELLSTLFSTMENGIALSSVQQLEQ